MWNSTLNHVADPIYLAAERRPGGVWRDLNLLRPLVSKRGGHSLPAPYDAEKHRE